MVSIVIFILLMVGGFGLFTWNILKIRQNILLGRDEDRTDRKGDRWKRTILVAFGQKKMFKRIIPAVLHLFIYLAFMITQIELIEIIVDGVSGEHRLFRSSLGGFYVFLISFIEFLSVFAFIATIIFLSRRNLLKLPRLNMKELAGWPKTDANLILIMELLLVTFIFMMNGADEVLYSRGASAAANLNDGGSFNFLISQFIGPAFFGGMSDGSLMIVERIGWWGHIFMVFAFLNYLPYSKHLHIMFAFPNVYYSDLELQGKFPNNQMVKKEVELMMDPNADPFAAPAPGEEDLVPQSFGAKDVEDLSWKNLMDAYTCTECGRCTDNCPANQTGKLLSPRKIMMDTRDRLEEKGKNIRKHGKDHDDGKSLLYNYITEEELWACTTCNACVETCPVDISPLSIIMQMRQYLVMEESKMPAELTGMNSNIENNGAPWQFSPNDRANWINEE